MIYWQVGAGFGGESGGGRSYYGIFLDFGVMLIGPGEYGEYSENVRRNEQDKNGRRIQRFVEDLGKCRREVRGGCPVGPGRRTRGVLCAYERTPRVLAAGVQGLPSRTI